MEGRPLGLGMKVFIGLTVFGMVVSWYVILTNISGSPVQPDLVLEETLGETDGQLSILISRRRNLVYNKLLPQGSDSHPRYDLAGLTDLFTSLAIRKLFDDGRLEFEDRLGLHLSNLDGDIAERSLASLLTHTSGLGPDVEVSQIGNLKDEGTSATYAGLNFVLLQQVVEKISGVPFHDFVVNHILLPHNLDQITWQQNQEGGHWSAAPDQLHELVEALNSNQFMRMKTHLQAHTAPTLQDGSRGAFAFAWQQDNHGGLLLERISSSGEGYAYTLVRFPDKAFSAVIMHRSEKPVDTHSLAAKLGEIYLGRELPFPELIQKTSD